MFTVDPTLAVPPFEQLKQQIVAGRDSGDLPADYRLPPVRALASAVGLAPNTVARAYRELERDGVIETRGRQGSFVTGTRESAFRVAAAAAREYAETVQRLGIGERRAMELVCEALEVRGV